MKQQKRYFAFFLLALTILGGCSRSDEPAASTEPAASAPSLADFELMARDLFFDNPERVQGRISPDGSMMSFMAPLDGVQNLWVGPLGDFDSVKPITDDKLRGISSHQWALNGRNVLYLRDQGGNEDFHIYSVDLDSGETRDLTPFEQTRGWTATATSCRSRRRRAPRARRAR